MKEVRVVTRFVDLGLGEALTTGLAASHITNPTKIQELAIPEILAGKDLLGQAPTGTGKTLAYLLPLFQRLEADKKELQVLILAPTHELVMQIHRQAALLAAASGIDILSVPIIGQVNVARQIENLKARPQVIVGSAGRVLELIGKKKITAHTVKVLVLDEADRLLDEQNAPAVEAVVRTLKRDRQVVLLSASLPDTVAKKAAAFMKEPVRVADEARMTVPEGIAHQVTVTELREKFDARRRMVNRLELQRALVFVDGGDAERVLERLLFHELPAASLAGSTRKEERQQALVDFKRGTVRLLVATDLAARGLDIPDISHVINFSIPETPEVYLHRAGRTGRAGKTGTVVSIATKGELVTLTELAKKLKFNLVSLDKEPAAKRRSPGKNAPKAADKQAKQPAGERRRKP